MRLLIYSDLHNEFEPFESDPYLTGIADVIVLAGDIDLNIRGVTWAKSLSIAAGDKPIIMVAGNHEFYGGHFDQALVDMRAAAAGSQVHLLENDEIIIDDVRFLGCTLWTDFELHGAGESMRVAADEAGRRMNDFRKIAYGAGGETPRLLEPLDTIRRHHASRDWLASKLAMPFAGPTIVVTHYAPSSQSIADRFKSSPLSPAFASNLESMMGPEIALWVHGHVHDSFDYEINGTRIVCNPRGYIPADPNPEFIKAMLVEV